MLQKLVLIFTTFFLIRKGYVGDIKLLFFGIASDTSEMISFREDGIYERPMSERFIEDAI